MVFAERHPFAFGMLMSICFSKRGHLPLRHRHPFRARIAVQGALIAASSIESSLDRSHRFLHFQLSYAPSRSQI